MNTKFTPGPWEVHHGVDVTGYPVFYIHGFSGPEKRDKETLDANTHLIAAAPELYEALDEVLRSLSNPALADYLDDEDLGRIESAKAALAKANGEVTP